MSDYDSFIKSKSQYDDDSGFEPKWLPDWLYPFQSFLTDWAISKGRAAIYADCGMGKTPMQLVYAENVVRHTNRPVLIATPLAVARQTIREAGKFGIDAVFSAGGTPTSGDNIVVTNYEKLHLFDSADFSGMVCDESSVLKNFDGKRKAVITEFMRQMPYRLLCTATAAPNDFDELGTSSEALGYLGYQDMLSRFFRQMTSKDHLGWGRTKFCLRSHATEGFWRWVCSWARPIRRPSDYGFDDTDFVLPELVVNQLVVDTSKRRKGMLFAVPAETLQEQREERRLTLTDRCEAASKLCESSDSSVSWCHLNSEGDLLASMIDGAVQVSGSDTDEAKEEKLLAFSAGQIKRLVTKPQIAGFGLNWQHCSHMTTFPSHSFEQWYQSVRRFLRFGQKNTVIVDIVTSRGEESVLANLERKQRLAEEMFERLIDNALDSLHIDTKRNFTKEMDIPSWL